MQLILVISINNGNPSVKMYIKYPIKKTLLVNDKVAMSNK